MVFEQFEKARAASLDDIAKSEAHAAGFACFA